MPEPQRAKKFDRKLAELRRLLAEAEEIPDVDADLLALEMRLDQALLKKA